MSFTDFTTALPALARIGWNPHWTRVLAELDPQAGRLARVVEQHRDQCRLHDGEEVFAAANHPTLQQRLQEAGDGLSVGDWVICAIDGGVLWIVQLLPRARLLARGRPDGSRQRVVANVDTALLVMGLDGDYSPNRLERYLLLVRAAELMPVILLTKPDRCDDIDARTQEIQRIAGPLTPVHVLDPRAEQTRALLLPYLAAGQTVVLLGSSGVGKSTLMNTLLGENAQKTQGTRAGDDTGRHTTTVRSLRLLPQGACLIDTPGVRELRLAGDEEVQRDAFDDIRELAVNCRFTDCRHEQEPGCAVVAGLPPERLVSYHKLQREIDTLQRSPVQVAARKQKDKTVHQAQKQFQRDHDKRR